MKPESALYRISAAIEAELVAANPRGMAKLRAALPEGYLLRAAQRLLSAEAPIAIITGFPVDDTIETDGPAGASILYETLESLGKTPEIWMENPMLAKLFPDYRTRPLHHGGLEHPPSPTPGVAVVIERPGASADGRFYNIRGNDISSRCFDIETLLVSLHCPVIAIGDGGNEIGMGSASEALNTLPIHPATATCDELIVADVSNWGAYALAALMAHLADTPTPEISVDRLLERMVAAGAVDGVTGARTPTEDNFGAEHAHRLLTAIQAMLLADGSYGQMEYSQ